MINLKIVSKFQVFCFTIKCKILQAPKQPHKILPFVPNYSFVSIMHL